MNLKNYYYYFQSALTPKICDDILAYGKSHQAEMAVTGGVSRNVENGGKLSKKEINNIPVSYTHLTLPTKRIV